MTDNQFLSIVNKIAAENGLRLPASEKSAFARKEITAEALEVWAAFLENCVKCGLKLADDRWSRLIIERDEPVTVFALEPAAGAAVDPDFRIGLHLLMRMIEKDPSA